MDNKKVIICDLDGTLAPSKSPISKDMAEVISLVLSRHYLAVVSGGAYSQFKRQFLSQLHCSPEEFENLYLFPTMGSTAYRYDKHSQTWSQIYNEPLSQDERVAIIKALNETIAELKFPKKGEFGELIEDRESQITYSALGQVAPIELKEKWDPDQRKRLTFIDILKKKIPQFEIRIGGTTSIDITKFGLDKAYAVNKIKNLLHTSDEDMIFVGDALYKGGNDEAVKKETDIDFIQEAGPSETLEFLSRFI